MLAANSQPAYQEYMPKFGSPIEERDENAFDENSENCNPAAPEESLGRSTSKLTSTYQNQTLRSGLGEKGTRQQNVAYLELRRRVKQQRHKDRVDPARTVFSHPKYVSYRQRPRRDLGPDGRPIWSDEVEAAFQHALINIEPMGKGKTVQHGKTLGRNELIAEWIFQETNEIRTRKQVSSHIQVLGALLKSVPEWKILTKLPDGPDSGTKHRREYYHDSIRQKVKSQKLLRHTRKTDSRDLDAEYELEPDVDVEPQRLKVQRLGFEMWVSVPSRMDIPLHKYTHLKGHAMQSRPLEDVEDWRRCFPDLEPIVTGWSSVAECDIILLEASFSLMKEFPPLGSKLGISLELDFSNLRGNQLQSFSKLSQWSCMTHMYQDGVLAKDVTQDLCPVHDIGIVRPLFESRWWALTFTKLTERQKLAEQTGDELKVFQAGESARVSLQHLTIMQQVFANTEQITCASNVREDSKHSSKRISILLWRVSLAPEGVAGETTWCRLHPPPPRSTIHSPPPLAAVALPPLEMDKLLEQSEVSTNSGADGSFHPAKKLVDGLHTCRADHGYRVEYQTRPAETHFLATHEQPTAQNRHPVTSIGHGMNRTNGRKTQGCNDRASNDGNDTTLSVVKPSDVLGSNDEQVFDSHGRGMSESPLRSPLVCFDVGTHTALQAQLEFMPQVDSTHQNSQTTHVGSTSVSFEHHHHFPPDVKPELQETIHAGHVTNHLTPLVYPYFMANRMQRPILQSHHSFGAFDGLPRYEFDSGYLEFANSLRPTSSYISGLAPLQVPLSAREAERPVMYDELLVRPHSQPAFLNDRQTQPNIAFSGLPDLEYKDGPELLLEDLREEESDEKMIDIR